ncbi:MAG: hypothetical protein IJZ34_03480 [Lachnospiraceae bacterium]|nr:hypothetical protein [Lachnospiraceae bacterium]
MKKKLLSVVLAASMVLSVCACGNDAANANGTSESQVVQNTTETSVSMEPEKYVPTYPIVEEPITIKGLVVGKDTSFMESRIVWDKVSEVTGINIEWEVIDKDALSTYLAGGDWPDIFHTEFDANTVNDYGITGGKFVNYLNYLDIMPNLAQTYEDYPMTLAASTQLNGEVYNLFKCNGALATAVVCRPHVRLDVLEDAGITELPSTVDEFYKQLVSLKAHYGTPSFILGNEYESDWAPMLFAAFGTLTQMDFADDGTGNVVFSRTSEQMKYYYEFLNKLYEEELMNREWLTLDNTAKAQLAESGTYAYITRIAAQSLAADKLKDGNWDYLGTCAPLTSEYDSTQEIMGYVDYASTCGMYINADSEYVEEICKMLDIAFATEEVVEGTGLCGQSFMYGMEGVDWVINEDGTYSQMFPETYKSFSEYQLGALIWINFGRADQFGSAVTSTPGNAQARAKGFVENVIPYQSDTVIKKSLLKFTEDEQYVLDNKLGEIESYYKQMEAEFITGAADIETKWDEYVATIEKMGIADVLEVYQAAYDRWNTAMAAIE